MPEHNYEDLATITNTVSEMMTEAEVEGLPEDFFDIVASRIMDDLSNPERKVSRGHNNLMRHAYRELEILGADLPTIQAIVEIVKAFSYATDPDGQPGWLIETFNRLVRFQNLTPLTDDPSEWIQMGPELWRSIRNLEAQSTDGGVTYTLMSEVGADPENAPVHTSAQKGTS